MTKKLYNYVEDEQHEEGEPNPPVPESTEELRRNLKAEVRDRRKPFRYDSWRFFSKKNFSSPWCLCCRHKDNDSDKLQGKARSRLYKELDILQIIQKLRVARFVAEINLTPEQRYLVNYHTEYMLFRDDGKASPFTAARYEDHRREEQVGRDDRIAGNVDNAIEKLNPKDNDTIKDTYVRIMARNRQQEEEHAEFDEDSQGNNDGGAN